MSMLKKIICMAISAVILTTSFSLVGCGKEGGREDEDIEVNTSQSQLYIANYGGGYGVKWLDEYIRLFQEKVKDVEYEPGSGKKGVQIIPDTNQNSYNYKQIKETMANSNMNIYFTESAQYYELVSENLLYDISDVANATCEGETRKISEKFTKEQNDQLTRAVKNKDGSYDGKYYALPSYQAFRGIVYDVDLFDEKHLYFSEDGMIECNLASTNRSKGPNGIKGDYDDGLPATYDEFFELCDYIKNTLSYTPICWTGAYKETYTEHLLRALMADAQGKDEYNLTYNLGTQDVKSCDIITGFDESGKPIIENRKITVNVNDLNAENNYKDLLKQKGIYYALDFLDRLVKGNYVSKISYTGAYTQSLTQHEFLHSRFGTDKPIAMMVEGTWWEEEASDIFASMEGIGGGRYQRRFGFLPLPKAPGVKAGPQTLYNGNNTYVFVNGNCNDVQARIAKDFLKFISSDEMLRVFTKYTGISKDYIYDVPDSYFENLSYYAKSVYNVRKDAQLVNETDFSLETYKWRSFNELDTFKTRVNGSIYSFPVSGFKDYNLNARNYFEGISSGNTK